MTIRRGTLIFTEKTIKARKSFRLAEVYAYPIIGMYIKSKIKEKGITMVFFMDDFNKRYKVNFSKKFVYNLIKGYHIRTIHFGHINMITSYFGTTIIDFCDFYAKNAEK